MQFPELDLSGLPDQDEPITDMDLSGLPDQEEPEPLYPTIFNAPPTVVNKSPSWLQRFRSPLTDIGRRTATAITPKTQPVESPYQEPLMTGLPDLVGSVIDESTAPINLLPTGLLGAGAKFGNKIITNLGRIASLGTAISGSEKMKNAEGPVDWTMGAIEALGGLFGAKAPNKTKQVLDIAEGNLPKIIKTNKDLADFAASLPEEYHSNAYKDLLKETKENWDSMSPYPHPEGGWYVGDSREQIPFQIGDVIRKEPPITPDMEKLPDMEYVTIKNENDIKKMMEFLADDSNLLYRMKRTANPQIKLPAGATPVKPQAPVPVSTNEDFIKLQRRMYELFDKDEAGKLTADELKEAQQLNKIWRAHPEFGKDIPPVSGKLDYSPTSEKAARQILSESGTEIPEGATNKQIIQLAEAVKPGYQVTTTKPVAPATPDLTPKGVQKSKVQVNLKGEFIHPDYPDYVWDSKGNFLRTVSGKPLRPTPEVERNLAMEILNTPRAINSSMDLSFPLRQGATMIHRPEWWKSWGAMVKSFGSDDAFKGVMESIAEKPNYKINIAYKAKDGKPTSFADWAGLAITDTGNQRELEHMRSLAERVPLVKNVINASNRGYTAYANKLRSDVFDSMVNDFVKASSDAPELNPYKNQELAKNIAGFVNNASGRGSVKELERYMEGLNVMFFSPRLQLSRAQMVGKAGAALFDPQVYNMMRPNVKREYLKSMMALGTAWGTMAAAAHQMGADVSLDPTNPDFMKIKIGNTRLDPGAGFQQFIVLGAKMAQQQATSSVTGKTKNFADAKTPFDPTELSTMKNFGYNKLAPLPRTAVDFMGRTQRQPFDIADQSLRLVSPIILQDAMEILTNEGVTPELGTLPLAAVGMGTQTYGDKGDRRMLGPNIGKNLAFPKKKGFGQR